MICEVVCSGSLVYTVITKNEIEKRRVWCFSVALISGELPASWVIN